MVIERGSGMKEILLIAVSLILLFVVIATWSCLVVGAKSEKNF
mgnify:FL=1